MHQTELNVENVCFNFLAKPTRSKGLHSVCSSTIAIDVNTDDNADDVRHKAVKKLLCGDSRTPRVHTSCYTKTANNTDKILNIG